MRKLLLPLSYTVCLIAFILWLPAMALVRLVTAPFDPGRLAVGRLFRLWAVLVVRVCTVWRARVEGTLPPGACVVVANHESFGDVLLLSVLPREMKWMAKESLFKLPWVGWMLRLAGDISVRRGDREAGARALQEARVWLQRGVPVMVFPEGTRSRTSELLPFKPGAFQLAIELGLPVVPVALAGTLEGMPQGGIWVRAARPRARVLAALTTQGLRAEDAPALAAEARERIAAARAQLQAQ
ncbi:1-acyl-sn-glycerol-3-phosphate acyltransferase [Aggregicoccus sp. 17bor-14]|uniref:lysophospholipid acyltransferase family protein n=1 Tax=Myxococcaceae TaxID=31 RepID=UPI00129CFE4D|nr:MULTISPECIES: lysophospholipid acyltransferase family protein [Myxococcaceae]MBF5045749.1 1-acyl-sn-glycerol-3-phosphate acyltransferase [Simulacricoccus sp. 17bor-14]MRI91485.1 1-acyl-sn-glycerol-3-phosphate acyltransferase [Aggregicoccus sp. 17bor-14]